jgi:WD40 repeat protein
MIEFKGHGEFSTFWTLKGATHLEFFPDGKKVASGGYKGFIKIWELSTGNEIMTFKVHDGPIESMKISPDGNVIAVGIDDNIRLWNSTTGNEIMAFKTHEKRVDSIEFSPDGKIIATGNDAKISIWDSKTGTELYQMIPETGFHIAGHKTTKTGLFKFSPDGKLFAVNRGTHVELWSINQEREDGGIYAQGIFLRLADAFLLPVFDEIDFREPPSLDISKNGQIFAASFGSAIVFDLKNRQKLWHYNITSNLRFGTLFSGGATWVQDLALHPNGKLLIVCTNKGISFVRLKQ